MNTPREYFSLMTPNLFLNGTDLKAMKSQSNDDDICNVFTWLKVNDLPLNIDKLSYAFCNKEMHKW